ncbi:hypothetical protein Tco_0946990, partial [Tanacetum coccineum]
WCIGRKDEGVKMYKEIRVTGTASDVQVTTSRSAERMLHPHADSDVFQRYTQFCARNVRLRFSADFAEAANANSVGTTQSAQMIDKLNLRSHSSVIGVTMDGHDPLNPQAILTEVKEEPKDQVIYLCTNDIYACHDSTSPQDHLNILESVEAALNPLQGKGSGKGGCLMRGDEAKEVCLESHLLQVPVARGKADFTIYRDAGSEVVSILARKGRYRISKDVESDGEANFAHK